jgi:C-terminal processing protease CtpA/Prc
MWFPLTPTLVLKVPIARSVNPVTGTNWEGTGVVPDVAVPAAEAHDIAYAKALRHVLSIETLPYVAREARTALDALPTVA